jgi:hypothetical protein
MSGNLIGMVAPRRHAELADLRTFANRPWWPAGIQNRRYTGDLVKRMMHSAGHDAGSPKSSSPSLAPRRNTNRRRSAQRVPVL